MPLIPVNEPLIKEKEIESSTEAIIYEFSPRLSYALLNRGKIRSEFSWFKVTTHPQGTILPWEMAEGKKAGDSFDWKFGFEFMFNHALSANLDYSGLTEPGRETRHKGKLVIRSNF